MRLIARTGVSSGDVVVGEATAGQHVLTGDTMTIATAMEQNAPPLEVLIAEPTYALVRDVVDVEPAPAGHAQRHGLVDRGVSAHLRASRRRRARRSRPRKRRPSDDADQRESRKTVTLVFADPRPMSITGEPISPEALREVMTSYFDAMRAALARHGATIEKFIGDAVMAVYGLPIRHEDDAIRAVRAAAEMQAALPDLNETFRDRWGIELHNHIGVNTGEVIAGDASTGQRLVTGDAVNTAARLEQAAGPGEIVLGELTYRLARDEIEVEAIAPLTLKGKAEPVRAYRLVGIGAGPTARESTSAPFVGREAEMGRLTSALLGVTTQGRRRAADRRRRCRRRQVAPHQGVRLSTAGARRAGRARPMPPVRRRHHVLAAGGDRPRRRGDRVRRRARRSVQRRSASWSTSEGIDPADRAAVAERVAAAMGLAQTQFPVAELFWGARKLLESLAREQPLVMIVDDIHAAEPTLLDLLDHLVELAEDAPILLLCSARHELVDRHAAWSEAHADQLIVLAPLSDDDTGRMIDEILGRAGLERPSSNGSSRRPRATRCSSSRWCRCSSTTARSGATGDDGPSRDRPTMSSSHRPSTPSSLRASTTSARTSVRSSNRRRWSGSCSPRPRCEHLIEATRRATVPRDLGSSRRASSSCDPTCSTRRRRIASVISSSATPPTAAC